MQNVQNAKGLQAVRRVRRAPFRISRAIIYLILSVGFVVYIYPLIWLVLNSLKHTQEIYDNPWGLPKVWIWNNYVNAFISGKTDIYMMNSVIITAITLAIVILLSSMAAFCITKMKWKASGGTLVYFLIGMMVPVHATLIPLFVMYSKMGMVNTRFGLILLYTAFGLPGSILILTGFFGAIQRELLEAAVIDGCSIWKVYWRIILPVSKPALFTISIFSFVGIWNELLVALVFISNPDKMTLPVGLTNFSTQYETDYAPLFAAIFMATLPSIIIYSFFNNKIIAGMTAGSIKT